MRCAYASRDKWRRLLVETAVAHEKRPDGDCVCGAGKYPCVIRRSIEYRNIGVAKQIEELEGLSDEEFEQFLYGDDRHLKPMDNDENADTACAPVHSPRRGHDRHIYTHLFRSDVEDAADALGAYCTAGLTAAKENVVDVGSAREGRGEGLAGVVRTTVAE